MDSHDLEVTLEANSHSRKGIEQTENKDECQYNKMPGSYLEGLCPRCPRENENWKAGSRKENQNEVYLKAISLVRKGLFKVERWVKLIDFTLGHSCMFFYHFLILQWGLHYRCLSYTVSNSVWHQSWDNIPCDIFNLPVSLQHHLLLGQGQSLTVSASSNKLVWGLPSASRAVT